MLSKPTPKQSNTKIKEKMVKRNCTNTMLLWCYQTKDVVLVDWPESRSNAAKYAAYRSGLACYTKIRQANFESRKAMVFIDFAHLVVRDGIDPIKLHHLLLDIEEYRDGVSNDMPGAYKKRLEHEEE